MNDSSTSWNTLQKPPFQWVRTIERILIAARLPELRGPDVCIFSDYSGDQKASAYEATGILYADLYGSAEWEIRRRDVRRHFLADGRRLSFKKLGDRNRQAALVPFLQAANEIEGLCLVVAVRKTVERLCVDTKLAKQIADRLAFSKIWKTHEFERMTRITHLIGLLIGGLAKEGQNISWISDEDSLFANESVTQDMKQMLVRFSSHYAKRNLGKLSLGTVAIDEGDRFEEDGAAVPDLVAGATCEILTRLSDASGGRLRPGIAIPYYGEFTAKTEVLRSWLAYSQSRLRKVCVVFEDLGKEGLAVFRFNM